MVALVADSRCSDFGGELAAGVGSAVALAVEFDVDLAVELAAASAVVRGIGGCGICCGIGCLLRRLEGPDSVRSRCCGGASRANPSYSGLFFLSAMVTIMSVSSSDKLPM